LGLEAIALNPVSRRLVASYGIVGRFGGARRISAGSEKVDSEGKGKREVEGGERQGADGALGVWVRGKVGGRAGCCWL
jgi:hypothetical protein